MNLINKIEENQEKFLSFTSSEIEDLGVVTLDKFNKTYGLNISNFYISDLKKLYKEIINKQKKFILFAEWLLPRFECFVKGNYPLRIYVGGPKQFIVRGDPSLEESLSNLVQALKDYINTGYTTPKRISTMFYYLNIMFK